MQREVHNHISSTGVGLATSITPNRQQSPPSREPFGHSLFDEQSAVDLGVISRLRPHKSATGKCDIWAESASLLHYQAQFYGGGANWYMALAPPKSAIAPTPRISGALGVKLQKIKTLVTC